MRRRRTYNALHRRMNAPLLSDDGWAADRAALIPASLRADRGAVYNLGPRVTSQPAPANTAWRELRTTWCGLQHYPLTLNQCERIVV